MCFYFLLRRAYHRRFLSKLEMRPWMEPEEIQLLMRYYKRTRHYLEFGAGGSTYLACQYSNIRSIFSVEASEQWVENVAEKAPIQKRIAQGTLQIRFVDINADPTNWSRPKDDSKKDNWHHYYNPWEHIRFQPDFILVDGRFRVSCVLHCLTHVKPNTLIAIHDYAYRPEYHVVEEFLDCIEYASTLYIFRVKEKINWIRVDEVLKEADIDCS
jgi:hypothetical protein